MAEYTAPKILTAEEAQLILQLRLLIARTANKDSLAWWDDESLTPSGRYLLERLFPMAPPLAGRSLALSAAQARHQAAFANKKKALHLYRLDSDNQDKLALRFEPLLPVAVPGDPIETIAALRQHLLDLVGESTYTVIRRTDAHGLRLEIPPPPAGVSPLLHRARTLAWAYLEGTPNQAVFPFYLAPEKPTPFTER